MLCLAAAFAAAVGIWLYLRNRVGAAVDDATSAEHGTENERPITAMRAPLPPPSVFAEGRRTTAPAPIGAAFGSSHVPHAPLPSAPQPVPATAGFQALPAPPLPPFGNAPPRISPDAGAGAELGTRVGVSLRSESAYAWLERLDGSGIRLPIETGSVKIGRHDDCEIVVKDSTISRQHATIDIEADGRATITDLRSANGIRLNGQPIERADLADGDVIRLGGLDFRFLSGPRLARQRGSTADAVECSVFAPAKASIGETIVIQVSLNELNLRDVAANQAVAFDPQSSWRGSAALLVDIERGAHIDVVVDGDGLVVVEPMAGLRWNGGIASCAFRALVPADTTRPRFVPTVHLAMRGVPVGRVTVNIERSGVAQPVPPSTQVQAIRYRRAFVSYCSTDRREVLKRLQALEALRVSFFADVLDLAPGERWEGQIKREIESCDLFLLFWSQAAHDSQWVRREIDYARQLHTRSPASLPAILPIVIEKAKPPEDLAHLHFNSTICTLLSGPEK